MITWLVAVLFLLLFLRQLHTTTIYVASLNEHKEVLAALIAHVAQLEAERCMLPEEGDDLASRESHTRWRTWH